MDTLTSLADSKIIIIIIILIIIILFNFNLKTKALTNSTLTPFVKNITFSVCRSKSQSQNDPPSENNQIHSSRAKFNACCQSYEQSLPLRTSEKPTMDRK